jgi:hypothetical protein
MLDLTRLTNLKYQKNPGLIIEECLETDDPVDEILHSAMALGTFGFRELAGELLELAPKYGLDLDLIDI